MIEWGNRFIHAWIKLQITNRGGKYSVERLLALDEYTHTVSFSHVLAVCLGTPIPTIVIGLIQELLPLQDPREGSLANYSFWIRLGVVGGSVAQAITREATYFLDHLILSQRQLLMIGISFGVVFTVVLMGIASVLVFPIPFTLISTLPLFYTILFTLYLVMVGPQFFRELTADMSQLRIYCKLIGTEVLMLTVYPVYQLLFTAAINTIYELPVILLLQPIKFLMKVLISINAAPMEDLMPEIVIFTVDFFNAFYLATCMQRVSSVWIIATFVLIDVCFTSMALYNLHRHTKHIFERYRDEIGSMDGRNLLTSVCRIVRDPPSYSKQTRTRINLHSRLHYTLSEASKKLIERLAVIPNDQTTAISEVRSNNKETNPIPIFNFIGSFFGSKRSSTIQPISIIPEGTMSEKNRATDESTCRIDHTADHSTILQEALETLFTSECHLLTEYLESIIPILYGCFVLVVVRLPNAQYHNELEGVTVESANSTVYSVFIYGMLEIASFVVLVVVMKRNCGMNALYQLAFVLETQMHLVQDKLIPWVLLTMAFRVIHFDRILDRGCRLLHKWLKLQVGHRGGKYSVERLLALEEYTRTVSAARVAFVCLCTPLPIILISVAQELLPLQDPKDGSFANSGFWVRIGLVTGVVAAATAAQAHFLVDRVNISNPQLIMIGLAVGITFPAIAMVLASALVFPVPFIVISGLPLFYVLWVGSIRIIVGGHAVKGITANRAQFIQNIRYACSQNAMVVIYPAYQTLFTAVINTYFELPAILLLSVLKLLMKNLLWLDDTHLHDLMPDAVIFSADFFNSFYLATCMQRTSSLATIVAFTTVDLCQTAMALYSFHKRTKRILNEVWEVFGQHDTESLLTSICLMCNDPNLFTKSAPAGINLRSCLQYHLSGTNKILLDNLEKASSAHTNRKKSTWFRVQVVPCHDVLPKANVTSKTFAPTKQLTESAVIQPRPFGRERSVESFTIDPLRTRRSQILRTALETLFTSECHVLTEYLESLIPVLYGLFVLVIVRLPNAQYHIELEGVTVENVNPTVQSVFIYGILEIMSFAVLVAVMQRNCGMNAMYQLAFVLETQVVLVQGMLLSWLLVTMAFRVVHFGKKKALIDTNALLS